MSSARPAWVSRASSATVHVPGQDVAGLPPAVDELPDERRLVRAGPVDLHAAATTKRSIAGSDVSSSIVSAGIRTPNSVSRASISSRWRSESQPGTSSLRASSAIPPGSTRSTEPTTRFTRSCTRGRLQCHPGRRLEARALEVEPERVAVGREAAVGVEAPHLLVPRALDVAADEGPRPPLPCPLGEEGEEGVLDPPPEDAAAQEERVHLGGAVEEAQDRKAGDPAGADAVRERERVR